MRPFFPAVLLVLAALPAARLQGAMVRLPPGEAEALLAREDLVVAEDKNQSVSVWSGTKKGVADPTAADGSAAWFRTVPDSWNVQWHWTGRELLPGLHYLVHAAVKVRKRGEAGEAFKGGVWDKTKWEPVIPTTVVSAGDTRDGEWVIYRMGSIRSQPGQYVWIGTSGKNHDNVPEVWVDRFFLVPDTDYPDEMAYAAAVRGASDSPRFALSATDDHATATLELAGVRSLTPLLFASPPGQAASATVSVRYSDGTGGLGEPVRLATVAGHQEPRFELAPHAPPRWDGVSRLSFELQASDGFAAFLGVLSVPGTQRVAVTRVIRTPAVRSKTADSWVDEVTLERAKAESFRQAQRRLRGLNPGRSVVVRTSSSLRKLLRHTIEPSWLREGAGDQVRVSAARHEYEGAQLVLVPLGLSAPADVTCKAGACRPTQTLETPGPVPEVRLNPVGYVKTEDLGYPVEHVGWWPDPLLPSGSFTLPPDGVQPVWMTVYVPERTPPGEYVSSVRVAVGAQTRIDVPVQVTVRPFTLSRESHLRTSFWLFRYHIRRFYGWDRVPWEAYKKYIKLATDHRLTPIEHSIEGGTEPYIKVYREKDGSLTFDYSEQDRFLAYTLDECHGNAFNVGYACWHHSVVANLPAIDRETGRTVRLKTEHLSEEYVATYTRFLQDYCAHLERKGWFDKAYHQMIDEPRPDYLDTVKTLHALSHRAVPDLKVLVTACWPPRLPKELVDIWVPLTPSFKPEEAPALRAAGDETWWYVCCGPRKPYANFFIEYSAVDHRILFWQSWKYGAQGILYWGLNYWTRLGKDVRVNVPTGPDDRWPRAPWVPNPFAGVNGDGYSMYPGPDGEPLSSIRLEAMRDGMEDYEYLYLLDRLCSDLKALPVGQRQADVETFLREANALLRVDASIVESMEAYTQSPAALLAYRERVAAAIERAQGLLR